MIIKFDSTQSYQLQAVQSVVDIFEGQPLAKGDFELSGFSEGASVSLSENGIANNLALSDEQILHNVRAVQLANGITPSDNLVKSVSDDCKTDFCKLNFTVEMETGTGKTYTYIRSVYELNRVYGFKKFVVVVPGVAIREGVIKNIQITHHHFQNIYGNTPINYWVYDRNNLACLRNFATDDAIQILVINIDSFTKDSNVINTVRETGVKPIEYIQTAKPIVIIDEPQNFETDVRRQAIANLHPLCTLRYSATHRNLYNLVYSLNPVQAYDLGLVKQIEVDGISGGCNYNDAYIRFNGVRAGKSNLKVRLTIYIHDNGHVKPKEITMELGDDLFHLSDGRDVYKDGYILNSINSAEGVIEFFNGTVVKEGQVHGGLNDEMMKFQIERTVKWHFAKVNRLKERGIKVLSLFFIDRVASYREYDKDGCAVKGKLARWFEEAFEGCKKEFPGLIPFEADDVHNGYFSSDKAGKGKEKRSVWIDSKENNTKKDDDTFSLIMKDKERLLSTNEPLQFIFSHSALREGWDNPNVFQICTLNESKSELKKRQEIGRGLRLPVDSAGNRVMDKRISVLTVIANETYESFSKALQKEIQEETSVVFDGRIKNAVAKPTPGQSKGRQLEDCPLFSTIWRKINCGISYSMDYSTEVLIEHSARKIMKLPAISRPVVESKMGALSYSASGVEVLFTGQATQSAAALHYPIPDIYAYIQNKVDITRNTIYHILMRSGRLGELGINPQLYMDQVVGCVQHALAGLLMDGVKFAAISQNENEMTLFRTEELESVLSDLIRDGGVVVKPFESDIEAGFVVEGYHYGTVTVFLSLPDGFKFLTPMGYFFPDMAVVFAQETQVYFISKSKSALYRGLFVQLDLSIGVSQK